MDKNQKHSRTAFTAWKKPNPKEEHIVYMCWAKEYTPSTGLEHYQGYVEFTKEYALFQMKSIFKDKTLHFENARKTRAINRAYCFKGPNIGRFEIGSEEEEEDILDIFKINQ